MIEFFYLLLFIIEPLRKGLGENSLTLRNDYLFYFLVFLLIVNLIFYIVGFWMAGKYGISKAVITRFFFLYSITLVFLWPIGARDVFSYVAFSRVFAVYHQNPYLAVYNSFSHDLFYNALTTHWLSFVTPYGPLFIYISSFLSFIFKNNLILTLALFKLFFFSLNILAYYLISKISDDKKYLLLYGWNPLILFEIVVNCHNDILTIVFLALGIFILVKKPRQAILAWVCFLSAVFIKYTTIFLLPLVSVYLVSRAESWKGKLILSLRLISVSILLAIAIFFQFWTGLPAFIRTYTDLSKMCPFILSPVYSLFWTIIFYPFKPSNAFFWGKLAGQVTFLVLLALIYLKLLFLAIRKSVSLKIVMSYSALIIFILLLTFIQFTPWYLTVLIFLLIISDIINPGERMPIYVFCLTFYGIAEYCLLR